MKIIYSAAVLFPVTMWLVIILLQPLKTQLPKAAKEPKSYTCLYRLNPIWTEIELCNLVDPGN